MVVSQASALSNCLFAVVIDVITGEVRKEPLLYHDVCKRDFVFFITNEIRVIY